MEERHGIDLLCRIILQLQTIAVAHGLLELLHADRLLRLGPDSLTMAAE